MVTEGLFWRLVIFEFRFDDISSACAKHAKIGGKLLGFNVDRKFSNVFDGLVVVDLRKTAPGVLERCMGREAAAQFRTRHGL